MINIAFVHSVAKIGGAERVSQMLMEGLDPARFQCFLVCPEQGDLRDWALSRNIQFTQLPLAQPGLSNLGASIRQLNAWRRFLADNQITLIHTADPYCTRALVLPAALRGVKVLSHYHFPFTKQHLSWLLKRLPKPDCCVFCSEDLAQEVGAHLHHIDAKLRLETIHNGVDINRFQSKKTEPNSPLRIGIVANLQKRKGHDEFIEMASLLLQRRSELQFDIIGGDILEEPREESLKAKVDALGIQENVNFHGQVPDVLSRLDTLDIVVCASHQEAFPIAILEAMAMQKAIVSTDVNGIPEAIIDNESGLLVPAFSADKLAQATGKLIDDQDLRERLGKNARERVVEHFNKSLFIERFASLYQELV